MSPKIHGLGERLDISIREFLDLCDKGQIVPGPSIGERLCLEMADPDYHPLEGSPSDLLGIVGRICQEQPVHANHFVRKIRRDATGHELLCSCGETYRVEGAP